MTIIRKIIYVILFLLIVWIVLVETACMKNGELSRENKICPFHYMPMSEDEINYENLKKVQVGMTAQEVMEIMGEPMQKLETPIDYSYAYRSSFGASGDFEIFFNKKTNTVIGVYKGN